MPTIKIALVGLKKIARDQHMPALAANDAFELVAVASPHQKSSDLPSYKDLPALIQALPDVSAVALCTPPQVRYEIARYALEQGLHVLLEKPPGVTVSEVAALTHLAQKKGVALFASWHSRHAGGVEPAREWLRKRKIGNITVTWKEDVRIWASRPDVDMDGRRLGRIRSGNQCAVHSDPHRSPPAGAEGGRTFVSAQFGDADSGQSLAHRLVLHSGARGIRRSADRPTDLEHRRLKTHSGALRLSMGGKTLAIDGQEVPCASAAEYPDLYSHFADLVYSRRVDVDVAPLQLVADAFLCGRRIEVEPFVE